jgi:tripartite-type tricarboxylate transporter receptor subunit TctC
MEWAGLVAPANVSADNLRILRAAYEKATQSPAFEQAIEHHGFTAIHESSDAFRKLIDSETRKWRDVVKAAGIVMQ